MASAFDLDRFIAKCCAARDADPSHRLVREVVARSVSDPAAVLTGLGEPKRSEVQRLYHSENLTILKVIWAPGMTVTPHDHRMWAVIGLVEGQEANEFFRRSGATLEGSGGRVVETGEVLALGSETIHRIQNPQTHGSTRALHVYGGDLLTAVRSMWTKPGWTEEPYDEARVTGATFIRE